MPNQPIDRETDHPRAPSATRPLYWSIRRELWENRSIAFAPPAVAVLVLLGFLISLFTLPRHIHVARALDPAELDAAVHRPFSVVAALLIVTAFLVGVFYCLDALHGERRDKSILFWKSLPVSDMATVLAKASIPLVVLPLYVFALIVATQLVMFLLSTMRLLSHGPELVAFWGRFPFSDMWLCLPYGLIVVALWHAPIYAWLLFVSAWARRAAFLWAVLPPLAVAAFEKIAVRTSHFGDLLHRRLLGGILTAFNLDRRGADAMDRAARLAPARFFGAPGLWLGLCVAAAFLAGAVWLRRHRGPI
jgi:ABC-2 type transport system permease protein